VAAERAGEAAANTSIFERRAEDADTMEAEGPCMPSADDSWRIKPPPVLPICSDKTP
jgi:hypothetical protein